MSVLDLVFCLQLLYPFFLILVTCLLRDWPLMLIGCWRPPRVPAHYKGSCFFHIWYNFDWLQHVSWTSSLLRVGGPRHATVTPYARFTLADPMPRLGSDVVGGNSGRNHPTSRRHTIHIGRMARNVSIRVGWYEGVNIVRLPGWYGERVLFITTLSCVVHVRLPIGRRRRAILNMFNIARWPPDGLPMRPRRPIPCRETIHIGRADSIGAQSGHRIG